MPEVEVEVSSSAQPASHSVFPESSSFLSEAEFI